MPPARILSQTWFIPWNSQTKLVLLVAFFLIFAHEAMPGCTPDSSPSNSTVLDINVTFIGSLNGTGSGKRIAGAYFEAIKDLNRKAANEKRPVTFSTGFYKLEENDEVEIVRTMINVAKQPINTAFVGPDSFCQISGLVSTALYKPLFAFNCEDSHNNLGNYSIVNTDPAIAHASKFVIEVLNHYDWKSFYIVTGTWNKWVYAANELKKLAEKQKFSINGIKQLDANDRYAPYVKINRMYKDLVSETKTITRIYVFLGDYESMIMFLRELHAQGLTQKGQHAVIAINEMTYPINPNFHLTLREKNDSNKDYIEAFRNTLLIQPGMNFSILLEFEERVGRRNYEPPINLSTPPPFIVKKNGTDQPSLPQSAYHLYDATWIYGETVMALMENGGDPTDASQVISYIRERSHFTSIVGYPIEILPNGESRSTYIVKAAPVINGRIQNRLKEVGDFSDNKFKLKHVINWVKMTPKSEPECGFRGELCPPTSEMATFIGIILGIIVPVIVILVVVPCRCYMNKRKLERRLWKINYEDIEIMNDSQLKNMLTPARSRKKESIQVPNQLTELLSSADCDSDSQPEAVIGMEDTNEVGMYKGIKVFIKQLPRKHLELNRPLTKQLQVRKEMSHENINRFIGACFEPQVILVSLYCARKSLMDILGDENFDVGEMFSTSLIQDFIRGMSYIHDSDLSVHGNLKSSNCLVDNRWTLKLSDFGLSTIGPSPHTSYDEKSFKKLLWTAPELLNRRFNSSISSHSNHQHHSQQLPMHHSRVSNGGVSFGHVTANHVGTQKGDVYAFAIILYEVYGRSGPWGQTEASAKEIIESLLTTPNFRPDMNILKCDENIKQLIEQCWAKEADGRPDFKHTISIKFKPVEQKYLQSNIIDNMLSKMELYSNNLEAIVKERTDELEKEKQMTETLLHRMLPGSVAKSLMKGLFVKPEHFECVTIYFSDIVGFTELSAQCTPIEVVDFLNELYTLFDDIIGVFDVYKVETIGDAYMVVSGLPKANEDRHAGEIASMSLMLLTAIQKKIFRIPQARETTVKIRIGIHSGPCCAGVVGLKMPRYCLFGDTVNTANRMESTGEAFKIHCSSDCKQILEKLGGYHLVERGYTSIKGKGQLLTYFLISENPEHRIHRISQYNRGNRCVSTSNLDYNNSFNLNRKCIPRPSQGLPQQSEQAVSQLRNSLGEKNIDPSSLNTTTDSSWSDSQEDPSPLHFNDNSRSNSIARPSSVRQSGALNMSPIAEDPWGPGEPYEWSQRLSRTSQPVSERDSLLSCHALAATGLFPGRRNSEQDKPPISPVSMDPEERIRLMNPETVL